MAKDIAELIHHLGEERAVLVGHDWGAAIAWCRGDTDPEVVERLGIINVPHPKRMVQGLRTLKQLRKSWYMFFFQLPFVPEKALSANDYAVGRKTFKTDPGGPTRTRTSSATSRRGASPARSPGCSTTTAPPSAAPTRGP